MAPLRATRLASLPLVASLAVLCAAGCDELLESKETRQRIEAVKAAVTRNPALVDAPDEQGQPPLHRAVIDGIFSLQMWLLDHRANPNARNAQGETALHVAAAFGTEETVRALLDAGADPRVRAHRGDTALHGAATPQPNRPTEECRRIIAQLVQHGADPNAANASGMAPLHMTALFGHVHVIEALLDAGARVDLEGPQRGTALSIAATSGHAPAVAALLARGADPSHRDAAGYTALEAALARPAMRYTASGSAPVDVDGVVALLRQAAQPASAVR